MDDEVGGEGLRRRRAAREQRLLEAPSALKRLEAKYPARALAHAPETSDSDGDESPPCRWERS